MNAVRCEALRFTYDGSESEVLRGVDIDIEEGDYAVIAGPSGAGKSTFCRTLNNIIPLFYKGKFSGRRCIAGEWIENQPIASVARKVGMVFQEFEQQLFSTSSFLDLSFSLENFGVAHNIMRQRVDEIADRFGIGHLLHREPFSMSGGEKQKLAIAAVLVYRPEILLLDEPTTDLDPDSRDFVLQMIPKLKDWVRTLIVVDHEMDHFTTADRVFIFSDGALRASGRTEEMLIHSVLLEENSLSPLDLVRLQKKLGVVPRLLTAEQLAASISVQGESIVVPERISAPRFRCRNRRASRRR